MSDIEQRLITKLEERIEALERAESNRQYEEERGSERVRQIVRDEIQHNENCQGNRM